MSSELSHERRFSLNVFNNQEGDLEKIKEEAVNQMEKLVASTNRIHELEDMNYFLQSENSELIEETETLRRKLEEKESMENELNSQIVDLSRKLVNLTIENENQKLEELYLKQSNVDPFSKNKKETELLNQLRLNQHEISDLKEKLSDQKSTIQSQYEKIQILRNELEKVRHYNTELESQAEAATDDRTKSELLEIIRTKIEEKIHWEGYAETLLRMIIANRPEIIDVSLIKKYCQISSSELAEKWNQHIKNILEK